MSVVRRRTQSFILKREPLLTETDWEVDVVIAAGDEYYMATGVGTPDDGDIVIYRLDFTGRFERCVHSQLYWVKGLTNTTEEEDKMTVTRYSDDEIRARFNMAEDYCDKLEAQLIKDCPQEIVDQFRIGEQGKEKELFRVLLIAPGMELEEGIYCVQASVDADLECKVIPHELVLECGEPIEGRYRVRLRTEAPTAEKLVEDNFHYLTEPTSWQQIVDWAQTLRALNVVDGWEEEQ